jgi:predicted HicB family RNase H-like nuclease
MNNVLTYKGFIGFVQFSSDDNVFCGKVEGINDLITFEGQTVQELKEAFQYVIDEHIKDCEKENVPLKKSYKGSFNIRLTPDLHRKAAVTAKMRGQTLNEFIKKSIEKSIAFA